MSLKMCYLFFKKSLSKCVNLLGKDHQYESFVHIFTALHGMQTRSSDDNSGMRGRVADVIICFKFYRNQLRGFRAVRGHKWGSSIDFDRRPYNRSALPRCL